jgi:hypothetical protein
MTKITADEEYRQLLDADTLPAQYHVVRCAVCGSMPELWEHKEIGGTWSKTLMCPNNESVCSTVEQIIDEGCPMFMPGRDFYKATRREAIDFWNKWNEAMTAQRRERLS